MFANGLARVTAIAAMIAVAAAGCAPKTDGSKTDLVEAAKVDMIAADKAFNTMAERAGLGPAFAEYMDPDIGFIVEGGSDPIRGRDAILEARNDGQVPSLLTWEPVEAYAASSGDFGFTWGTWRFDPRAPDHAAPARTGKYVTVWHKREDGSWKGLMDTGVSDPPPPDAIAPPPPLEGGTDVPDLSPTAPPPVNPSDLAPPEIMHQPDVPPTDDAQSQ